MAEKEGRFDAESNYRSGDEHQNKAAANQMSWSLR